MKLWIARDKYGLWLMDSEPYIINYTFTCDGNIYRIDWNLFTEITFKNSPQEVELKLI